MHIAIANFYFLSVVGKQKMPPELKGAEKTVTSKPEVIAWLKRALDGTAAARPSENGKELQRKVNFAGRETTAEAVYLRMIVHANEHMGQLVAYARMTGVVPPWSQ